MAETFITGIDGSLGSAIATRLGRAAGSWTGMKGEETIRRHVDSIPAAIFHGIKHLVINDGTNGLSWIGSAPPDAGRIVELNVMSAYWFLDAFVSRRSEPMRVLFIASQTYRVPQRTTALYCASKAAVVQMMRVAARELAPAGWIVNALAPGKIEDTEMSRRTDEQVLSLRGWSREEAERYALGATPAGRFTSCAEVAEAVEWALEAPSYVNGTVLEVMGGV
jgi:2-keto-3-deoxy-L-fuconate dehydrogenase